MSAPIIVGRQLPGSPWLWATFDRVWLPVWFACIASPFVWTIVQGARPALLDGTLYLAATRAWLAGEDPWSISVSGVYFAAPPPSLLPVVPFAAMPDPVGLVALEASVVLGAVATVRLLHLPWWWILFPPLIESVISGNVQSLLIPLILLRLGPVAVFVKAYAGIPLLVLRRWRSIALAVAALVVTFPFLPWPAYIAQFSELDARLAAQTNYALPTLAIALIAPLVLAAAVVVGPSRSAWLLVPALWPSQQYYYGTLAMGARSRLAGAIVAAPVPGGGAIALVSMAVVEWSGRRRTIGMVTAGTGSVDSTT